MPGTVTVACSIPAGVFIRAFKMEKTVELVMGGGTRDVEVARNVGEPIRILGPGRLDRPGDRRPIASGYALTHNVDADVFETWIAANRDSKMVQNRLIFAHAKAGEVEAKARAHETQRTGLEPLDPQSDTRAPKKRTETRAGGISAIETAAKAA